MLGWTSLNRDELKILLNWLGQKYVLERDEGVTNAKYKIYPSSKGIKYTIKIGVSIYHGEPKYRVSEAGAGESMLVAGGKGTRTDTIETFVSYS